MLDFLKAIVAFVMLAAPILAVARDEPDIDYMAMLMQEASRARHPYPDLMRINPTLSDETLYAVQHRLIDRLLAEGHRIGGFKGGLMPAASLGGVLLKDGILKSQSSIDASRYVSLLVEAEIGFEFCQAVREPLANVEALKKVVCQLHPAIELPDAAVHDLASLKSNLPRLRRALIPNNMATKNVLLGAAKSPESFDLLKLPVVTSFNGEVIGKRDLTKARDLWPDILWLVNEFVLKERYTIDSGYIIIPGNLTGLHPGKPGHYRVDYGKLGKVEFDVAGPHQSNK